MCAPQESIRCNTMSCSAGARGAIRQRTSTPRGYLAANPDVAAAGINPLDHYLQFGIFEGRTIVNDGVWH